MNYRLKELRTIAASSADKLSQAGVSTTAQMLRQAATPEQRKALAAKAGIDEEEILTLVNRSDLSRIKGIGPVFSDLLEFSGVNTVVELAKRVPENLHARTTETAVARSARRAPHIDEVRNWVSQAKSLERKITY